MLRCSHLESIPNPMRSSSIDKRRTQIRPPPETRFSSPVEIVYELSSILKDHLRNDHSLSTAVANLLADGNLLFEAPPITVLQAEPVAVQITANDSGHCRARISRVSERRDLTAL